MTYPVFADPSLSLSMRHALKSYYDYKTCGPAAYQELASYCRDAGEFLSICEKMPPHRLRFAMLADALTDMIDQDRANEADIFRAQRLATKLLGLGQLQLKDYIHFATHPDIHRSFKSHEALDFFLGLAAKEIEDQARETYTHDVLGIDEEAHNSKIDGLIRQAKTEKKYGSIKTLLLEKITPLHVDPTSIRKAAAQLYRSLCSENCCDHHRQKIESISHGLSPA